MSIQTITIFAAAVVTLSGTILAGPEGFTTIQYKKPRSSKFAIRSIPDDQMLASFESDEEGSSEVTFLSAREGVYEVTGEVEAGENGNFTVTDAEGNVFTIGAGATDYEIVGDAEEVVEKPAKGAGKPAKGAAKETTAAPKKPAKKKEATGDELIAEVEDDDQVLEIAVELELTTAKKGAKLDRDGLNALFEDADVEAVAAAIEALDVVEEKPAKGAGKPAKGAAKTDADW